MSSWQSITDEDFRKLFAGQYGELSTAQRDSFDRYSVIPWKAVIRRSQETGDEQVFVVAESEDGVLYFDDVEYGFNISSLDGAGRIASPGGSQNTLQEAVTFWFRVQA